MSTTDCAFLLFATIESPATTIAVEVSSYNDRARFVGSLFATIRFAIESTVDNNSIVFTTIYTTVDIGTAVRRPAIFDNRPCNHRHNFSAQR